NWEVGTIINLLTGPAVTGTGSVSGAANLAGICKPWGVGNGAATSGRPLIVERPPRHIYKRGGGPNFINPAAFTWEGFALGGYDNGGIGQCAGPGFQDVDFSLDKNWKLPFHAGKYFGEQARIQFRFEAFNLFNHPMFQGVNTAFDLVD